MGAGLRKEATEAVARVGQEEGYGSQSREEDRALPTSRGRSLGPRERAEGDSSAGERKGEARGEAWDRLGPRGRFTR